MEAKKGRLSRRAYYGLGGSLEEDFDSSDDESNSKSDDNNDIKVGDMKLEQCFPAYQCSFALFDGSP